MNGQQYYAKVIDKIKNSFKNCHYVIAAGGELLHDGWDPNFLVAVEPISELEKFTLKKGMQVHMPVIGQKSTSVLMPLDFEVFLLGENHLLYTDKEAQRYWFKKTISVCRFVEEYFQDWGIPYLLDYTPSGAHLLWQNYMDQKQTKEIEKLGYLEEDLIRACQHIDKKDIKRKWGISLEAAKVFSGLTKLAEYVSLLAIDRFKDNEEHGELPVTISDSLDRCINMDSSWCEGSPFMRSIRSPFSLHKKNHDKYGMLHHPPLVDIIGTYFDGKNAEEERDIDKIVDSMWNLEMAAEHAERFTGEIPTSNSNIIDFIKEYKASALYEFHCEFDKTKDIPRHEAIKRAREDNNLTDFVKYMLWNPNPMTLQPKNMYGFIYDMMVYGGWKPKHIANVLRDLYIDPVFNWSIDFFKYCAEEKANFWARTFSALALQRLGKLN